MNGIIIAFALLGMTITGFVITILFVPLIYYLMERIAYVIALTLYAIPLTRKQIMNKIKGFSDNPVNNTQKCEPEIYPPKPIHSIRNLVINEHIVSQIPFVKQFQKGNYTSSDKNSLDIANHSVTEKFNQMLNIPHSLIKFYRKFYSASTKCKQNQYNRRYQKEKGNSNTPLLINASYY